MKRTPGALVLALRLTHAAPALVILLGCVAHAADSVASGTIEGRVLNARSGEYLVSARITVERTALETFTDLDGNYRLTNVPAGSARVTVFYTGLPAQTVAVSVGAGQTVRHDITLAASEAKREGGIVKLDQFIVDVSREMDAAALAINEQRFSSNIKNVVSTEEFGNVAEGNVAEFLKFLPGVTINYIGGNARDISINGVPSDYVPVTVDGFSVASAAGNDTSRTVQSDMISINNLSRIEVSYSPTPETQGAALAGSVNMVSRSSFERSKPVFNASAYVLMRDNARNFKKVPGPTGLTRLVQPGFDFSYVAPVNKRFGYTLSGGFSSNYSPQDSAVATWRGANTPTNGAAFPHTTPDQPYLSGYVIEEEPKVTTRRSVGATVDYKLTARDRVTLAFQYSSFDARFMLSNVNFDAGRVLPGDFTPTSTRGAPGAGILRTSHEERNRFNRTYMPTFVWRHDGPTWKADGGLSLSQQSNYIRDTAQGFFRTVSMQRNNVTISFDDIFYLRPRVITVRDGTTGAPIDPYSLASYSIVSGTGTSANTTYDLQRTAYGSLRRDFFTRVPFTLKTGFDLRESVRDIRVANVTYNYVGRDGRASTTPVGNDDSPVSFFDPIYSQRILPYGFPKLESPSNRKIWEHSVANPGYFTTNENTTYRAKVTNSKYSREVISSLYLRGDVALFERRLKLVGGVRAEQTNIDAEGQLSDPTRNFQRNASGQIIRDANGLPAPIIPASNALGVSQRTFIDRGAKAQKEYLRWFPSLNASYNIRENVIARASYYHSIGRPNFVQYSGGITLPDTDTPPAPNNQIVVNNAAIKAWTARTINVRLERYFEGVGQFSVGAFRRHFENFFDKTVFNATPEFFALYGLDPAVYAAYDVSTQHNIERGVRMEGVDFNYKQALTFLPPWARGIQVFANGSAQRALGDANSNFAGYIPRSGSWGASLTREKYNVRVNWNYRGRQRNAAVTGIGLEPGTFNWSSKRLYIDVLGEYYIWKRMALFANLRNVGDATEDVEIAGPSTPAPAQFRRRLDYASLWTFGIKGSF